MARRLRLSIFFLLAAGCQYVTGLEDLEIVASSQGAGPQGGAAGGAGGTGNPGGAPSGAGGGGGAVAGGAGGVGGTGGEGGTPVVTTAIHDFASSNLPLSMAQNQEALFFSNSEGGPTAGRIWRWPKDGGFGDAVEVRSGEQNPTNLWVAGSRLYWSRGTGPHELVWLDLDDLMTGTPEVIATAGSISDFAVDPSGVEFFVGDGDVQTVGGATLHVAQVTRFDVRDGASIFAANGDEIDRVQKDGSPPLLQFMTGGGEAGFLAVSSDKDAVFAIGVTALERRTKAGPSATLIGGLTAPGHDVAVDDLSDDVYFAIGTGIHSMPKTGGDVTMLAPGSAWRLLIDADSIYWFDIIDGDIWRTTR